MRGGVDQRIKAEIDHQIDDDGAFGLVRQSISKISKFYFDNAQAFKGSRRSLKDFIAPR
jgi:hypothetical protein